MARDASPKEPLSPAQARILDFIRGHVEGDIAPPSIRDVAARFGIEAPTALFHLRALERKGYIRRTPGRARSIELLGKAGGRARRGIPIVGRVAAGEPILAVEHIEGVLPLSPDAWGTAPGAGDGRLFALRVRGESMIDDGILDGDLAIVREQPVADPGDVVVVLLGEGEGIEATLKRYHPEPDPADPARGRVVLRPANRTMGPLVVEGPDLETFRIVGKVVGVMRWLLR